MKLPHADRAFVPPEKLTNYLLSASHPVGRAKAAVFSSMGFSTKNADALAQAFLKIAHANDVEESLATAYGVKYTVVGTLDVVRGEPREVKTVWIVLADDISPRFITAYPAE